MRAISCFVAGNKVATMSLAFLIIVVATAVFAPCLAPYDPDAQDFTAARQAPSFSHPFGTDFQGSDVLSKIIYGARATVAVAFGVSTATVALGFLLGILAGYKGGLSETVIMRVVDVTLAFPALLLNIILVAILGAGFESLFLALTLTGWAAVARITRGLVISLANAQYVTSAHALGATGTRILLRHIVPNCASTIVIVFAMRAGATVLAAAGLNYLGLGDPQDTNSWGTMVNLAQFDIVTAWWWSLAPATAIALTVLAMNLIADAARDYLDPRSGANLAEQR